MVTSCSVCTVSVCRSIRVHGNSHRITRPGKQASVAAYRPYRAHTYVGKTIGLTSIGEILKIIEIARCAFYSMLKTITARHKSL